MKVGDSLRDSAELYRVLKASDGTTLSLSSILDKGKPLVLFFYPKANTPGCTKEVRRRSRRTRRSRRPCRRSRRGGRARRAPAAAAAIDTRPQQAAAITPPPTYPRAHQACKFRDDYAAFTDAGATVYGISSDSPEDNKVCGCLGTWGGG